MVGNHSIIHELLIKFLSFLDWHIGGFMSGDNYWEIVLFSLRYLLLFKVMEKSSIYGFGHWDIVLFFANTFVMEKSSICGWEIYLFCIILNTHRIALDVSTARFIEIALENQKDFYPGPRDRKKRIIQITTS